MTKAFFDQKFFLTKDFNVSFGPKNYAEPSSKVFSSWTLSTYDSKHFGLTFFVKNFKHKNNCDNFSIEGVSCCIPFYVGPQAIFILSLSLDLMEKFHGLFWLVLRLYFLYHLHHINIQLFNAPKLQNWTKSSMVITIIFTYLGQYWGRFFPEFDRRWLFYGTVQLKKSQ